jgi:spermidine synthase
MPRNRTSDHDPMQGDAAIAGGTSAPHGASGRDATPLHWRERARATTSAGEELVLRERAGTFEIRCNGWDLMSSRAHHSEQVMARMACRQLGPAAPRVLIGGLGMGFTLRAALDVLPGSAVVVVAELIAEVIAWNQGVLAPLAGRPLDDPRVRVACADVAAMLQPHSFDAILLDVDNGPGAVMLRGNGALYAPTGMQRLQGALRRDGRLAVWSADPSPRFERTLRNLGLSWARTDVPARGVEDDPLHTIYLVSRDVAGGGVTTHARPGL